MIRQPINIPLDTKRYQLLEEYVCPISGVVIPQGFVYDGASVPRILWTLTGIRPDGPYRAGATVHDWIYRNAGNVRTRIGGVEQRATLDRSEADRIFRDLLASSGVSAYRSYLAWCGVRSFGWCAWDHDGPDERG